MVQLLKWFGQQWVDKTKSKHTMKEEETKEEETEISNAEQESYYSNVVDVTRDTAVETQEE